MADGAAQVSQSVRAQRQTRARAYSSTKSSSRRVSKRAWRDVDMISSRHSPSVAEEVWAWGREPPGTQSSQSLIALAQDRGSGAHCPLVRTEAAQRCCRSPSAEIGGEAGPGEPSRRCRALTLGLSERSPKLHRRESSGRALRL